MEMRTRWAVIVAASVVVVLLVDAIWAPGLRGGMAVFLSMLGWGGTGVAGGVWVRTERAGLRWPLGALAAFWYHAVLILVLGIDGTRLALGQHPITLAELAFAGGALAAPFGILTAVTLGAPHRSNERPASPAP